MFTRARLVLAAWFSLALVVTLVGVGGVAYGLIRAELVATLQSVLREE